MPNAQKEANTSEESSEEQLVIFHLGNEAYGVDILHVDTVIIPQTITRLPKTTGAVLGVINLRGSIIPVVDLRAQFQIPQSERDPAKNRIMIVRLEGLSAGILVDAVTEVIRLPKEIIEPATTISSSIATDCILGIAQTAAVGSGGEPNERLVLVIDIEKALSACLQDSETEAGAA